MIYLISLCSLLAFGVSPANLAESCNYYCSRTVTKEDPLISGIDDVPGIVITENYIEVEFDYVITQTVNNGYGHFFGIGADIRHWLPEISTLQNAGFQINNPDIWHSIQPQDLSSMRHLNTGYHIAFYYDEGVESHVTFTDTTTNGQSVKNMNSVAGNGWSGYHGAHPIRVLENPEDLRMSITNICIKTDRTGQNLHVDLCISETPALICPRDATTFDWDELTTDGIEMNPQINVIDWSIDVDTSPQTDLTLNIEVRVPYVVRASADDQLTANFGTTYVLDFEDFDAHKSSITQPNTCSNRLESDYIDKTTTSSRFEILSDSLDAIGTSDNMCYPATDGSGWEIIKDDDCNSILYKGKWTWGELRECRNNGNALTDGGVQQTSVDNTDPNYLQLFGTFYVNMISPFWYEDYTDKNMDFYRIYQLISQPFVIQISKSVYVIGNTGINVMTMSIIAVYKEDEDEDYILILLTEAAEYMQLKDGQIIEVPTSGQFTLAMQSTDESNGCLNNKAYLCSQLWKIYTTEQTCTNDRDEIDPDGGIDFSGDYRLRFTPQCRPDIGEYDSETHCKDWLDAHPIFKNDGINDNNVEEGVALSSHLTFVDGICKARTFTIQLEATMNFYENEDYTGYIDPDTSPHLYQVGEDTVYGEIILNFPTDTEMIFDSKLVNVWLCTFPPDTTVAPPDQNGPDIDPHDATNGGCFSDARDGFIVGEGDEFFFHVYGAQEIPILEEEDFIVNVDGNAGNDVIHFEFTVPHEIQRDTLYVHAQIEVLLEELELPRRRRLLLDVKTKPRGAATNKIAHFGQNIGITNEKGNEPKQPQIPPQEPILPIQQPPLSEPFTISLNSTWVIIIGALLSIILLFNIILMCYMNCCKGNNGRPKISFSKNRRSGYDSVKHIDSEEFDDSEANLINVN